MPQQVHIAVVTYNRLPSTIRCLETIRERTRAAYRLTVVDNASRDDTRDYLLHLRRKGVIDDLYLFDRNMGVACGYNFALSVSREPFFVRLDNDILIEDPAWADVLMQALTRCPQIGSVGFHIWPGTPEECDPRGGDGVTFVQRSFTSGACSMSRREVHEQLGFWCEDYGIYGEEDSDFGLRLGLAGLVAGYIDKCNRYVRHEHTPYDTDDVDPLRSKSNRLASLETFFLNKFMYENGHRELFMQRRYDTVVDGVHVSFQENPAYARFMDEVAQLRHKLAPALAYSLQEYLNEG
ncbi:glycosyltransferase [Desulfovibrio sp. TomC]|uniref:glycosyltransferase n=1 Tax=Desulfovibrio sp. TomC TaxID=1562888 RepID=UPI000574C593|nr:glycosyltransferase [Desulfovibrio sp. TomC]KHK02237.1 glycosyl transferase family 2 [Desulfovibrio sp. TomC]